MGLSTTAAYGILFTASLLMLATLLNSLIYSYALTNQGMENRSEIIQSSKNIEKFERIVYNSSRIEIYAYNEGPLTLNTSHVSVIVNGSVSSFTYSSPYWYPGSEEIFDVNTSYSFGEEHSVQFKMDLGNKVIATAEYDKLYVLNESAVAAYFYSGEKAWSVDVNASKDIACGQYLYVLNASEILMYNFNGIYAGTFGAGLNITAIAASENYVYGISNTTLYIFTTTGSILREVTINNARDIAVGAYLYTLVDNTIYEYTYTGTYITSFTDWRITNATKIAADPNMEGSYLFVLNNGNELLVYSNGSYAADIPLAQITKNIDVYGKIYLSTQGVMAMNMGYRVKLIDEYGNEIYGYL